MLYLQALSGNIITGAMTFCFIQAVESEPGATYGRVLASMRSAIRSANTGISVSGPIASLVRRVFGVGLNQVTSLRFFFFWGERGDLSFLFLMISIGSSRPCLDDQNWVALHPVYL